MKRAIGLLIFSFLVSTAAFAHEPQDISASPANSMTADQKPKEFADVGIAENLGGQLNLNLEFKDEDGNTVKLGKYFDGQHPVSLSLMYYGCPGLCSFHFNGVIDALKGIDWNPGEKFQVLAISFDSRETSDLANKKKQSYIAAFGRLNAENGIHFLTADESTLKQLTSSVGFQAKWVAETKEWAHASAAIIATPTGNISRYLHGIMFDSKTFKFALAEASRGSIGSVVERVIWYCFHYDPKQGKYTIYAFRAVQVGAIAIILFLGLLLLPVWIRGRKLR